MGNLHRSDGSDWTGISPEDGEGGRCASLLDIVVSYTSGESGLSISQGLGNWDDIGTVDHLADILTKRCKLSHDSFEGILDFDLVVYLKPKGMNIEPGSTLNRDQYALTKDCHSQAVRESRARVWSDWRRISPCRGDSTSPWFPPVPGKTVPRSWVSTKN